MGDVLHPERERDVEIPAGPGSHALGLGSGMGPTGPCFSGLTGLQQSALPRSLSSRQSPGTRRETRNETVSEDTGAFHQKPNVCLP